MAGYEVSANLNIDIEDFERKVDDAIGKVNALKEALESLNELSIGIKVELIESA